MSVRIQALAGTTSKKFPDVPHGIRSEESV